MRTPTSLTAVAVTALLAVSLTACGSSNGNGAASSTAPATTSAPTAAAAPSSAAPSSAAAPSTSADAFTAAMNTPTTLEFWTWVTDVDKEVSAFTAKYPAIKVNVTNAGQGGPQYTKLEAALQAGTGIPDVAQIEYQYIPTFRMLNALLDISPYVGSLSGLYPDWVVSQVSGEGGVWGIPQDTGPMGMLYREDLLQAANIAVPTTYDEFAKAVTDYHAANPDKYLVNMPSNDPGAWLGLFWQAGAQPFTYDGKQTVSIKLTSDAIKKVIDLWQPLITSGAANTDPDWTDQWYAGLNDGTYASMLTAAWAPMFLQGIATDTSGKWRAAPLPQWDAAKPASGNWGGSTDAVMAATKNPIAAAELARFINQDATNADTLAKQQSLFPALNSVLNDPTWANDKPAFYGGQTVNQVFAQISQTVNVDFQWPPFLDFVYSNFNDTFGKAMTDKGDLWAGMTAWQDAVVAYAQQQGFTVQ